MSKYFPGPDECAGHTIFPGVRILTAAGQKMMVSLVDLEAGSVVEEHAHPHEQVGVLLSGRMTFTIGGETKEVSPGDVWVIPGGVKHKVIALEASKAVDVFAPPREDYL